MIPLWVALGAAVGAPARYLADRAVQARHASLVPWGTFTVNMAAALVLGILTGVGSSASAAALALLGTGFCGSLSTYSTFSFETMRLVDLHQARSAAGYAALTVVTGCSLAALGWWLA
ncbi:fluoride efflux transporter CrcB [Jatrophihabitans sp.]|uniref:fluoride efflux transporter CrcB n=1 Tax=Jatrophihabitans sp. TaxID=1932789 RepID=UPI0030C74663|nr:crcB [Jatrophihabitans sp.]